MDEFDAGLAGSIGKVTGTTGIDSERFFLRRLGPIHIVVGRRVDDPVGTKINDRGYDRRAIGYIEMREIRRFDVISGQYRHEVMPELAARPGNQDSH